MDIREKVAIVTGGDRGIGKAISLELSRKGALVAVIYHSNEREAGAVVSEIMDQHGQAIKVKCDVSVPGEVAHMMKTVLDRFGTVDILVNNAGVTGETNLLKITEQDWDRVLAVNLKGVFNCCQAAIRHFLEQGQPGKIINFSSIAGKMGGLSGVHYAASKAGVIGLTMALSTEFSKKNIWINAICPGPVRTELLNSLPEAIQKKFADSTHVGRMAEPGEMAHAVIFLLENDFVAGETLNISAGRYMD